MSEVCSSLGGSPLNLTKRTRLAVAGNENGYSAEVETEYDDGAGTVREADKSTTVQNENYKALLNRTKNGDARVLSEFTSVGAGERMEREQILQSWAFPWLRWDACWLPDVVSDGGFIVQSVESPPESEPSILRLRFVYDPSKAGSSSQGKPPPHLESGFIDVEPTHRFRIVRYQYRQKTKISEGEVYGELTYGPSKGGFPTLSRITVNRPSITLVKHGLQSWKGVDEFVVDFESPISAEEFTLSHYGIPEAVGPGAHEFIRVENPTYVADGLAAGEGHEVVFQVRNDASEALEIVGCQGLCTKDACFGPKRRERIPLPPHQTVDVPFELTAYRPGSFAIESRVFVRDRSGLRSIDVRATGRAAPALRARP
jgi:hypothetical protein